jgi:HSP20 family protein
MARQADLMKSEPQSLVDSGPRPAVLPACDVYESKDEILVIADVPGATTEGLNVGLEKGELTVRARRNLAAEGGSFVVKEYGDCDFHRRFVVPGGVDAETISAELKNGVLRLHLPKSEAHKPRQITVAGG